MIQITKNGNKVILSISVELDKEDLIELGGDLSKHAHSILNDKTFSSLAKDAKPMLQNREIDTTGWSKEKLEAYQQAQSKLELENKMNDAIDWAKQNPIKDELKQKMKRVFVDVLDTEYLETKFATTYKLDALNREVEVLRKKLNDK